MRVTLVGSARFEKEFKEANERLTLDGHVVYSLAVYPSDKKGKDWYTPEQKEILDKVHKLKIKNSDAVYVIRGDYLTDVSVGASTRSEINYALKLKKKVYSPFPISAWNKAGGISPIIKTCGYAGCTDLLMTGPCALCYE